MRIGMFIFWKLLTYTMGGVLIYAVSETPQWEGKAFVGVLAMLIIVIGTFTTPDVD